MPQAFRFRGEWQFCIRDARFTKQGWVRAGVTVENRCGARREE
jgi:hypothetical protein